MTDAMVDLSFDLGGGVLPADYRLALWNALLQFAPNLTVDERIGLLPLRTAEGDEGLLLSKRAKMVLRLPLNLCEHAAALCDQRLEIEQGWLQLGRCKVRSIEPYPTLHAPVVASDDDEMVFMDMVREQLTQMKIDANLICGMRSEQPAGYSLVVHDLKPEASVRLQAQGLGGQRGLGCGVFVHYKLISGLE